LTDEHARLLGLLSACADRHACLKAVYIFGSVARGDARPESDLDIALEYRDDLTTDATAMHSFDDFQRHVEAFSRLLARAIGRKVSLHGAVHEPAGEDAAWPAIRRAASQPVARRGKVTIAATPRAPRGACAAP